MSKAFFDALERIRWRSEPDVEKRRKAAAKIEQKIRADERLQIVTMIRAQLVTSVDEVVRYIEAKS